MIIRLVRARISPGRSADFHARVREEGLPHLLAGPGLLGLHVGRREEDGVEIAIVVSVWRDWDALTSTLGDDATQPYLLTLDSGLVTSVDVEHFEALEVPPGMGRRAGDPARAAGAPAGSRVG